MPRIRTLKPEHKQHRKVGPLSDAAYRLWVGMITEADDEGRLIAECVQLKASIFPYQPRKGRLIVSSLSRLCSLGLIRLYEVGGVLYAAFPNWSEHQRIHKNHFTPSKLPAPPAISEGVRDLSRTDPGLVPPDRKGMERKGMERKGGESEGREGPASALQGAPAPDEGQSEPEHGNGHDPGGGPLAGSLAEFMAVVRRDAASHPQAFLPPRRVHDDEAL